jgi:uncharacterized damage-inducible protein DinB
MPETVPEPWLRGVRPGMDPVVGHLLRASEQIREDVERAITPLSLEQLWAKPQGMTSAGFHAKHLAGSTDRLCTYLEGSQLSTAQLEAMEREEEGAESASELISRVSAGLQRYEQLIRELNPERFGEIREVGRKRLESTAISLAIHIAEHGQRHTGQLISAAKLARAFVALR